MTGPALFGGLLALLFELFEQRLQPFQMFRSILRLFLKMLNSLPSHPNMDSQVGGVQRLSFGLRDAWVVGHVLARR